MRRQTEFIVVGSGPGGASVARQLARAGRKVILLERGRDERGKFYYGTYLGPILYTDRSTFLYSKEGLNIIRPLMVGGATSMYCGSAALPPAWLLDKYHVDIRSQVQETIQEIGIAALPPQARGAASTRLAEAAIGLGYKWEPLLKFMRSPKQSTAAEGVECRGANCMLGCRCGAKWNAGEWVDQAVAAGCELITQARVDELVIEHQQIGGVRGTHGARGEKFEIEAKVVVLAAGGIGTPLILQKAGFADAGRGIAMDTTTMLYGASNERGIGHEPPMTWAYADDEVGYMLSTLIDPWLNYPIVTAFKGWKYPLTWPRWNRTLGVMIKLKDDITGGVVRENEISKPMSAQDHARLQHAAEIARRILVRAGAQANTIFMTPPRGTHPCATVRLGDMLDVNLQTKVKNLFVCDASAFPEALDRPTVLTILGLGKRLAEHLLYK